MIRTLDLYFFRRYIVTTIWFLLGIFALVFIIDFSEMSNRVGGLPGYTLGMGLVVTALRIPMILMQTVPFVALFAGMAALISLNRRYELVVTRAAGISAWQFLRPFLLGAFLFGVAAILTINPLAAWGSKKAQEFEASWGATNAARSETAVPWLRQIYGKDQAIIGAKAVLDGGMRLMNVSVIHFDTDNRITLRQDADQATLEDGYWLLKNVRETRAGELPVRLDEVQLRTNLKQEFVQESLEKPETIAFFNLGRKIEAAKSFGFPTHAMETQLHTMLALPLLLVAMTLIAACVSLKFSRSNQSRAVILGGILSGFMLYVVTVLVKAFGSSGVVPPFVAAWLPVVVAMSLGATILLHQEDG
jgi:lipopolysaccharide export system permease protein